MGSPRRRERLSLTSGQASRDETWPGANEEKRQKLQRNKLQRLAQAQGLELRHSAYGYALFDSGREQVDDRNDMTLDEVGRASDRAEAGKPGQAAGSADSDDEERDRDVLARERDQRQRVEHPVVAEDGR